MSQLIGSGFFRAKRVASVPVEAVEVHQGVVRTLQRHHLGCEPLRHLAEDAADLSRFFTFQVADDPEFGSAEDVARVLFSDHLVPFELASVLLLVAMVGALMLARGLFESPSEGK